MSTRTTDRHFSQISVVIPARDEEQTLRQTLQELAGVVTRQSRYRFEIIVVDDHSADRTGAVGRAQGARVIANHRRAGKGNALRTGFDAASGEVIVMADADCSHRMRDLPRLLLALEAGAGLVVGSRATGGSDEYHLLRALGNRALSRLFTMTTGVPLSDALNGFKAFRAEVYSEHRYRSQEFEIEIELLVNAARSGLVITEVPSHERARGGGKQKSRVLRHGTRFVLAIVGMGTRYRARQLALRGQELGAALRARWQRVAARRRARHGGGHRIGLTLARGVTAGQQRRS